MQYFLTYTLFIQSYLLFFSYHHSTSGCFIFLFFQLHSEAKIAALRRRATTFRRVGNHCCVSFCHDIKESLIQVSVFSHQKLKIHLCFFFWNFQRLHTSSWIGGVGVGGEQLVSNIAMESSEEEAGRVSSVVSASPLFHVCMHSACQVSTAVIMQLWAFISLRPTVTPSASHLTHASIILSTPHTPTPLPLPHQHFFFCHIPYSPLAFSQFATCRSAVNVFMFFVFFLHARVICSEHVSNVCVFRGNGSVCKALCQKQYTHRLSSRLLK